MFSFTIDTGLSFAVFRQVACIGEQCFSSCHAPPPPPDLGHFGHALIRISTVTLNTTLTFCIFTVCDVSKNFSLGNFIVHS